MTADEFMQAYTEVVSRKLGAQLDSLPFGIRLNHRPWECNQTMEHGGFASTHSVLDVGALHTYFGLYVADFAGSVHVTDNFYWAAREYNREHKLQSPVEWCQMMAEADPRVTAGEADIQDLPFESASFDRVVCVSTIEHVIDDKAGIREMLRVLKPGGSVLLTTEYNHDHPKPYSEEDGSYYRIYDQKTLEALVAGTGFSDFGVCVPGYLEPGQYTSAFFKLTAP